MDCVLQLSVQQLWPVTQSVVHFVTVLDQVYIPRVFFIPKTIQTYYIYLDYKDPIKVQGYWVKQATTAVGHQPSVITW